MVLQKHQHDEFTCRKIITHLSLFNIRFQSQRAAWSSGSILHSSCNGCLHVHTHLLTSLCVFVYVLNLSSSKGRLCVRPPLTWSCKIAAQKNEQRWRSLIPCGSSVNTPIRDEILNLAGITARLQLTTQTAEQSAIFHESPKLWCRE